MARKLVDLEEAAQILGISADEVNRLREKRELFAYRDGGTWKFKPEDIERYAADRGTGSGELDDLATEDSGELMDLPPGTGDDLESVLLSEVELGGSADSTMSTIIGKSDRHTGESDLKLADDSEKKGDSDVKVTVSDGGMGSDVKLVAEDSNILSGGAEKPPASGSDFLLMGSDVLNLQADDITLGDSDNLTLEEATQIGTRGKSDLDLDDKGVLDEGSGSDITIAGSDSGISLDKPSDSGLSLEEPLELGGSGLEMMELGEDDVISLDDEEDLASAEAKTDDEFLLTPLAEAAEEESDSGSQVIALDSEEDFGGVGAAFEEEAAGPILEEETAGPLGTGAVVAVPGLAPAGYMPGVAAAEAPYSVWNIVSLSLCAIFLLLCGMMMFDLIRNLWSFNEPYSVNSSLMDTVLKWF